MSDTDTIVCAVGRPPRSERVAEMSRRLAEGLGARVVLTHVFDPMAVPVPPTRDLRVLVSSEDIEEEERQLARSALARAADVVQGVAHEPLFAEGQPLPEILRVLRQHHARLLVVGSAARKPLDRIMQGSLSAELAVRGPCPVVVVTDEAVLDDDGPLLAAYDGSEDSLRAARLGAALAAGLGRPLVLMHVAEEGKPRVGADQQLARELHEAARSCSSTAVQPVNVTVAVEHGEPVEEIVRAAQARGASLIIVGNRGRNAVQSALLGSVSAGVVRVAPRPVVVAGPASEE